MGGKLAAWSPPPCTLELGWCPPCGREQLANRNLVRYPGVDPRCATCGALLDGELRPYTATDRRARLGDVYADFVDSVEAQQSLSLF